MAERKTPAERSRRHVPEHAKAAGKSNLAKGREAKAAMRKKAKEEGRPTASERWAMLLDGRLTVKDLDDEEIKRMQVRTAGGDFSGKRRKTMPSHIAAAFRDENMRRATAMLEEALPDAIKALVEIAKMSEKDSDRIKAANIVVERVMGKTPQEVIARVTSFDEVVDEAVKTVGVDRDL